MPKLFPILYAALLGTHLAVLLEFLPEGMLPYTKLSLVVSLIALTLLVGKGTKRGWLPLLAGLVFSVAGDGFLLADDDFYFSLGLGAFLLTHISYAVCFRLGRDDNHEIPFGKKYLLITLGLIVFGLFVFLALYENLGDLLFPVALYIAAIIYMATLAINRFNKASMASFAWVLVGACLFLISDFILAQNRFNKPIDMAPVWIMLTYGIAQFSIVWGMLLYLKEED